MEQATFSVRMDSDLKQKFDRLCMDFGMTATTAFNIFARVAVRERRIPFEISSTAEPRYSRDDFRNVFLALRKEAAIAGVQDMSLEEINAEIDCVRKGRADIN